MHPDISRERIESRIRFWWSDVLLSVRMADQKIKPSEITPECVYLNRRNFIRAGLVAGTTAATGLAYRFFNPQTSGDTAAAGADIATVRPAAPAPSNEKLNTFEEITNYNNFYELSTDKRGVARETQRLVTRPWTVDVGGLVQKPRTFDIDELLKFD